MAVLSSGVVLLIDGYNMIGAWKTLQQLFQRDGLEAARQQLIELLTDYSAFRGYDAKLVFDAQHRPDQGSSETVTQSLSVHYTDSNQTADTWIERNCALLRMNERQTKQRVIVATSDRAQQLTVVGYGAEWMSAQQLEAEVKSAKQELQQVQHRRRKKAPGRTLAHTLDAATLKRMREWRMAGFHSSID